MVRNTSQVVSGPEVKEKLLTGAKKLALAVGSTLGPYGRTVAITKIYNLPHITKDGATVCADVALEDSIENIASETIKEASKQTAILAGDGTSSTTVFAEALFRNLSELKVKLPLSVVKSEIEGLKNQSLEILKDSVMNVKSKEDLKNIALVASNNDEEMSNLVADAFDQIGVNGIVSVSETKSYKTFIDTTDGIKLDRSHINSSLIKKNKEEYPECNILVTDLKITKSNEALMLLNLVEETGKPLLVICEDLEGDALQVVAFNRHKHDAKLIVVRAPFIAEARKEASNDLAIATGATFVTKDLGWEFSAINSAVLGKSDSVTITLKETNILGRKGDSTKILERINFYNKKIEEDYEGLKVNYKKRLAYFNGGASVIYLGGVNEVEVQEKKDRLDDTIRAVRASLEEGIVSGGGTSYTKIINSLDGSKYTKEIFDIFKASLNSISEKLAENFGGSIEEFQTHLTGNIIDPALVIKSVLENSVSAALMLNSINVVVQKNEDNGDNH